MHHMTEQQRCLRGAAAAGTLVDCCEGDRLDAGDECLSAYIGDDAAISFAAVWFDCGGETAATHVRDCGRGGTTGTGEVNVTPEPGEVKIALPLFECGGDVVSASAVFSSGASLCDFARRTKSISESLKTCTSASSIKRLSCELGSSTKFTPFGNRLSTMCSVMMVVACAKPSFCCDVRYRADETMRCPCHVYSP